MEKTNFEKLISNWEKLAMNENDSTERSTALFELATACTQSVLKKCYDTSGNETIRIMRRDIMRDLEYIENVKTLNAVITQKLAYKKDGSEYWKITDAESRNMLSQLVHRGANDYISDGDAISLINVAVIAILEQSEKTFSLFGKVKFEKPYTVNRIRKRVLVNESVSIKQEETTAIQEVYRIIRREIDNSKAVKTDPKNGYLYLSELVEYETDDTENTEEIEVYKRLPKYSDLGTDVVFSSNNQPQLYSTSEDTEKAEKLYSDIIPLLTKRQLQVLRYRLKGMGYGEIAEILNVTKRAIKKTCEQIQKKAETVMTEEQKKMIK